MGFEDRQVASSAYSPEVSPGSKTTKQSQDSITSTPAVLGTTFQNPSHISDQINVTGLLDKQKKLTPSQVNPVKQTLGGLLIVSGGVVTLAVFGLIATFLKPSPK